MKEKYDASSITVLRGTEPVRTRIGMFLGDPSNGDALHHCFEEAIANCIDEYLAGYCKTIEVSFFKDNSISVEDDGRGIPIETHKETKISALTTVLTTLHAGAKFNDDGRISIGLHGVGISAVNAVSSKFVVEVKRNGHIWSQEFSKGVPLHDVKKIGKSSKTGTRITFTPDYTIFKKNNKFDLDRMKKRIVELSCLNPGVTIWLFNEHDGSRTKYKEKGISSFVKIINQNQQVINGDIIEFSHKEDNIHIDIALQWIRASLTNINCYANTVYNGDGGTHLQGFRIGINRIVNKINDEKKWIRGLKESVKIDDTIDGLTAVISVKIPNPSFDSQTKNKLINDEVRSIVDKMIAEKLGEYFETRNRIAKPIFDRIGMSAKAREAAKKARENVVKSFADVVGVGLLPGKFADCTSKNPAERELFICEGQSAGGTLKGARNRRFQAVYPMRGKVLNVEKAKLKKILDNEEISNMMQVVGVKVEKNGKIDYSNIRFHKIIICCDADSDGNHIACLLLTMFYRYMRPLLERGYVYVARTPLYRLVRGTQRIYVNDDGALQEFKKKNKKDFDKYTVNRFKGLGELTVDDMINTSINPENRNVVQIKVEDAKEADDIFSLLMGSDVEPRKWWLETNATYAKLDI